MDPDIWWLHLSTPFAARFAEIILTVGKLFLRRLDAELRRPFVFSISYFPAAVAD